MAGVHLRTIAEVLGHRTLQIMRYSYLAPGHTRASAVDQLVKARNQRDTKSDIGSSAAKATKRNIIASS
jgi:hypothetical protein